MSKQKDKHKEDAPKWDILFSLSRATAPYDKRCLCPALSCLSASIRSMYIFPSSSIYCCSTFFSADMALNAIYPLRKIKTIIAKTHQGTPAIMIQPPLSILIPCICNKGGENNPLLFFKCRFIKRTVIHCKHSLCKLTRLYFFQSSI